MTQNPDTNTITPNTGHEIRTGRAVVYTGDSVAGSSSAATTGTDTTAPYKRYYIESEANLKDRSFIVVYIIMLAGYLGFTAYGCYLSNQPVPTTSSIGDRLYEKSAVRLRDLMLTIFSVISIGGVLSFLSIVSISYFPKIMYQIFVLCGPFIYVGLACYLYMYWSSTLASSVLLFLAVLHLIYLALRRKHIRLYRILMIETADIGYWQEKYVYPSLLWIIIVIVSMFSLFGGYGLFKFYLYHYYRATDSALYAFYFSIVVFGWLWNVNLIRNMFKTVVIGLNVNRLLREGPLYEEPAKLRPALWSYASARYLGQVLHSSAIVSLCQTFCLLVLFMQYESFNDMVGTLALVGVLQHCVNLLVKQFGLIHCVMFGSSFFDGTFDSYVPILFYDELCSHVISLASLLAVVVSAAVSGRIVVYYWTYRFDYEIALIFCMSGGFVALVTGNIFFDSLRATVATHIIAYGENPVVMSRTSPLFTEAARRFTIMENPGIIGNDEE